MLNSSYKIYATITGRNLFIKFNKLLFQLSLRGLGIYNYQSMRLSGERLFIEKILYPLSLNKKKFLVFDVGANIGDYTKIILDSIKNSEIYTFEPHPETFKRLETNLKKFNNVKFFNCALSSTNSYINLYDYSNNDGSSHASLSSEIFTEFHKLKTISHKVNVYSIEKIVEENRIQFIDFLKIDVEGYELEVLKGCENLIKNKKIGAIQFEFTQLNSTVRVYFKDFYDILFESYDIYRLLPHTMLKVKDYDPTFHEIFAYQNYVAILKK